MCEDCYLSITASSPASGINKNTVSVTLPLGTSELNPERTRKKRQMLEISRTVANIHEKGEKKNSLIRFLTPFYRFYSNSGLATVAPLPPRVPRVAQLTPKGTRTRHEEALDLLKTPLFSDESLWGEPHSNSTLSILQKASQEQAPPISTGEAPDG